MERNNDNKMYCGLYSNELIMNSSGGASEREREREIQRRQDGK